MIILTPASTHTSYFDGQLLAVDELDDLYEFMC